MEVIFANFEGTYSATTLIIVVASVGALFFAASAIALYRIIRGPSILDRMIATDVLLASIMCGMGGYVAISGRTDVLPFMLVIAMFGFVGSVAVSRYVSRSDLRTTPGLRRHRRRDAPAQGTRGQAAKQTVSASADYAEARPGSGDARTGAGLGTGEEESGS